MSFGFDPASTGLGIASGYAGYKGQQDTNSTNLKIAKMRMDFEDEQALRAMKFSARQAHKSRKMTRHMSNTAFRRSMRDMRKAGLNPILAYQQGGASTATGQMGQGFTGNSAGATMENEIEPAISTAMSVARTKQELSNLRKAEKLLEAQEEKAKAETGNVNADTKLKTYNASQAAAEASIYDSIMGQGLKGLEILKKATGGLIDIRVPDKKRKKTVPKNPEKPKRTPPPKYKKSDVDNYTTIPTS